MSGWKGFERFVEENPDKVAHDPAAKDPDNPNAPAGNAPSGPVETEATPEENARRGEPEAYIGIDPGQTTGLALRFAGRPDYQAHTLDFWRAVDFIVDNFEPGRTRIVIEDPSQNTFMYGRHVQSLRRQAAAGRADGLWKKIKIALNIAMKVGRNQREAQLMIQRLEAKGFDVRAVRPTSKKWDRKMIKRVTGYDGSPNNEHVRDAIKALHLEAPPL